MYKKIFHTTPPLWTETKVKVIKVPTVLKVYGEGRVQQKPDYRALKVRKLVMKLILFLVPECLGWISVIQWTTCRCVTTALI